MDDHKKLVSFRMCQISFFAAILLELSKQVVAPSLL